MDTPLYVLSTAASMVESADVGAAMHNGNDHEETAAKRSRPNPEDQPISWSALTANQHVSNHSKKCAGTQTSFSSFPSSYSRHPGSLPDHPPSPHCPQHDSPPPPYYQSTAAFHPSANTNNCDTAMETDNTMPLNLTISSSSHQNHSYRSQTSSSSSSSSSPPAYRPSVITRSATEEKNQQRNRQSPLSGGRHTKPDTTTGDLCDPEIEEHFRRSLGPKYPGYNGTSGSNHGTANVTVQAGSNGHAAHDKPDMSNISITGNVDDHFAKSLGDTWTKLQAQKEARDMDNRLTGTVDDHFAKALGDTWFKIKAQKETGRSESTSFSTSKSPFPHPASSSVHL